MHRERVAHRVPQRLADPRRIHRRPRDHRPAVVELPDDGARRARPGGAPVVDAVGDRTRLDDLRHVVPTVDVLLRLDMSTERRGQLGRAVLRLEMVQHQRVVGTRGRPAERVGHRREGRGPDPAELRDEARTGVGVVHVVLDVPHVPRVEAAPVHRVRRVHRVRVRGPRPVRPRRVHLADDAGQQVQVVAGAVRRTRRSRGTRRRRTGSPATPSGPARRTRRRRRPSRRCLRPTPARGSLPRRGRPRAVHGSPTVPPGTPGRRPGSS